MVFPLSCMSMLQAHDKQTADLPEELTAHEHELRRKTPAAVQHQDQRGQSSTSNTRHVEDFMPRDAQACQVSLWPLVVLLFV